MIKPEALPDDEEVVVVEFRREAQQSGPKLQGARVRAQIQELREDIAARRIALWEQDADPAAPQG